MEAFLCKASALTWAHSVSPHSLHSPRAFSMMLDDTNRLRVWCSSDETKKANQMTVSITGAPGFIGRRLVERLHADNHYIHVLTRSRSKAQLIFLGKKIKNDIKASRIRVTSKVVDLINSSPEGARPTVLAPVKHKYLMRAVHQEMTALAEVCREWEAAALKVNKDVRLALICIGIVLGKDGGAVAKMIPIFMMFAGGPLGSGQQWFTWIHLDDIVNLMYEALSNPSYKGVINGTAPNPVRMVEICSHLGKVLGRPSWLPVPDFALKAVLGEGASVVLEGQKVLPTKAKELGFQFQYPYVQDALKTILS